MHSPARVRMIDRITPLVITYNEAPNIARTLDRLTWAKRIVVIDSGSTDETLNIIRSFPQAQAIHRKFDDCASQWNFGNDQVQSEWVLSLHADYELSEELVAELAHLILSAPFRRRRRFTGSSTIAQASGISATIRCRANGCCRSTPTMN